MVVDGMCGCVGGRATADTPPPTRKAQRITADIMLDDGLMDDGLVGDDDVVVVAPQTGAYLLKCWAAQRRRVKNI